MNKAPISCSSLITFSNENAIILNRYDCITNMENRMYSVEWVVLTCNNTQNLIPNILRVSSGGLF